MDPYIARTLSSPARDGEIPGWVHDFLCGPGGNQGLSDGLRAAPRWWRGPLPFPLEKLERCCGPEPEMEYRVESEDWDRRIASIADFFVTGGETYPPIAEYRDGALSVRDGNHRLGALTRLGVPAAQVLIWYNSHEDYERHGRAL